MDEDKDKQDIISERLIAYFLALFAVILGLTLPRIVEVYNIDVSAEITLLEVVKGYIPLFISLGISGYLIIISIFMILSFKVTRSSEDNNKDTNSRKVRHKILAYTLLYTTFAIF